MKPRRMELWDECTEAPVAISTASSMSRRVTGSPPREISPSGISTAAGEPTRSRSSSAAALSAAGSRSARSRRRPGSSRAAPSNLSDSLSA